MTSPTRSAPGTMTAVIFVQDVAGYWIAVVAAARLAGAFGELQAINRIDHAAGMDHAHRKLVLVNQSGKHGRFRASDQHLVLALQKEFVGESISLPVAALRKTDLLQLAWNESVVRVDYDGVERRADVAIVGMDVRQQSVGRRRDHFPVRLLLQPRAHHRLRGLSKGEPSQLCRFK